MYLPHSSDVTLGRVVPAQGMASTVTSGPIRAKAVPARAGRTDAAR